MNTIGIVGGGRVARILLSGWARSGRFAGEVTIYDKDPAVTEGIGRLLPGHVTVGSLEEAAGCDVVLLALHPPVLLDTLASIRPFLNSASLVVSLGPKITLAAMKAALGGTQPLARVNPSAPGFVGFGLNPMCFSEDASPEQRDDLLELFGLLGSASVVAEEKLEAYALISAMGPTYFWFQWATIQELGVQFGLDPKESEDTVESMVQGALKTLFHSGLSSSQVMDLVPVKPLGDREEVIKTFYKDHLGALYAKIKPVSEPPRSPV